MKLAQIEVDERYNLNEVYGVVVGKHSFLVFPINGVWYSTWKNHDSDNDPNTTMKSHSSLQEAEDYCFGLVKTWYKTLD